MKWEWGEGKKAFAQQKVEEERGSKSGLLLPTQKETL